MPCHRTSVTHSKQAAPSELLENRRPFTFLCVLFVVLDQELGEAGHCVAVADEHELRCRLDGQKDFEWEEIEYLAGRRGQE